MIRGLKPYSAYKDSGVPSIGKIPRHWQVRRLKHAFQKIVGGSTPSSAEQTYWDGGIVWVTPVDVSRSDLLTNSLRTISREGLAACSSQLVPPGSVIVTSRAPVGNVALAGVELCTNQGCKALVPNSALIEPPFAFEVIKLLQPELQSLATGTTFAEISTAKIATVPIPLPPLPEQSAIIRFLDYIDWRIRRYTRAKQKIIALLNEQKQAIIHRAVTRGLDPNVRLKPSGVEGLDDIPEHWEIRRIKSVCSAIVDCKNRTPKAIDTGSYTVVRTTCIREGQFHFAGSYRTDGEQYQIWTARGAPRIGDVFFTREAPAGEACLVPDRRDLCMGQRMMYFRPDPSLLDARFLLLNIYGPLVRRYVALATNGSTVGHLRLGQVYALPITWCPIEEQHTIVAHVLTATADLERSIDRATRHIGFMQEYRTRLIADVTTGRFDVREAAAQLPEEPAEAEPVEEMGPLDEPESAELEAAVEEADA